MPHISTVLQGGYGPPGIFATVVNALEQFNLTFDR